FYTARVLVPGRPTISLRRYGTIRAARAAVLNRWPTARIVDAETFREERTRRRARV
ncbi:MAG: hypothetical protein IRY97_10050, partial [Thermomicrobiaceae bacterium]|nr:hypothetical protein [Thermomicrobiaceae bacterium]